MCKRKLLGILTLSMIILAMNGCGKADSKGDDIPATELQTTIDEETKEGENTGEDENTESSERDVKKSLPAKFPDNTGTTDDNTSSENPNGDVKTGDNELSLDDYKMDLGGSDKPESGKKNGSGEENKSGIEAGLITKSTNRFAYQMIGQLGDGNYFISPYSLCSALGMVDNAAAGNTQKQMNNVLMIDNLDKWNEQIKNYSGKKWPQEVKLNTANALWISKKAKLSEKAESVYYPKMAGYYDAQIYMADFKDKEGVAKEINNFVSKNTDGMIDQFKSPESIGEDTMADIINAVYFSGEWTIPFCADDTHKAKFYGENGDKEVDMMCMTGENLGYFESDGLKSITLPYADGSAVMNIIISRDNNKTAGEIFSKLSVEQKDSFIKNAISADKQRISMLEMPKFKTEYKIDDLKGKLIKLGMSDLFDMNKADLSILADNVCVSSASHVAKIEVDELGSRAGAVTEITLDNDISAMGINSIEFCVDHPFIYVISDKESGMILFIGQNQDL